MAISKEERTAERQSNGDHERPVPTTEATNGEIKMDPAARAPAIDASEHVDALDGSASSNPVDPLVDSEMIYFGTVGEEE